MRSAEEYLSTIDSDSIWGDFLQKYKGDVYYEHDLIELINKVQRETLAEASLIALQYTDHQEEVTKEFLKMLEKIK